MNILQAIILGVLQGATEFLPVSSSGHLVLVPWLLGWSEPGLAFDTVVHWGTALAVVAYFWREWVSMLRAALRSLRRLLTGRRLRTSQSTEGLETSADISEPKSPPQTVRGSAADARLAWLVLLGTVPAALIGGLLDDFFEEMFARPMAAAAFLLVTAVLLTASERLGRRERDLADLTWLDALVVGLAQALAIFPGISRSGATISAGLARGLQREPSARFSFFLATPIILGAGFLQLVDLAQEGGLVAQAPTLIAGFLAAAAVGFGCIYFLLRYLQRRRLYPFAIYCAVAGVVCLIVALTRGA